MMKTHRKARGKENKMPPIVVKILKVAGVAVLTFIVEELLSETA